MKITKHEKTMLDARAASSLRKLRLVARALVEIGQRLERDADDYEESKESLNADMRNLAFKVADAAGAVEDLNTVRLVLSIADVEDT